MYIIKAIKLYPKPASDPVAIHDSRSMDKDFKVISASLNLELNRAGTLSFVVPPNNYAHKIGMLIPMATQIKIYYINKSGKEVLKWKGRILDWSKDFYGRTTYNCEGWLGVLNDTLVRPKLPVGTREATSDMELTTSTSDYDYGNGELIDPDSDTGGSSTTSDTKKEYVYYTSLRAMAGALISNHNKYEVYYKNGVKYGDTEKRFSIQMPMDVTWNATIGKVSGNSDNFLEFPYANYETTLSYFETNLIGNPSIGGFIRIGYREFEPDLLYYYPDAESSLDTTNQEIVLGQNLLDLTQTSDGSGMYTEVIPLNGDLRINPFNPDLDYVKDDNGINTYGVLEKKIDCSGIYTTDGLAQAGVVALNAAFLQATSIELNALDLSLVTDVESIDVGFLAVIRSSFHNISTKYICTSAEINITSPAQSRFVFGLSQDRLTERQLDLIRSTKFDIRAYYSTDAESDIAYMVMNDRIKVTSISFTRANGIAYLTLNATTKKEIKSDEGLFQFNIKFAPVLTTEFQGAIKGPGWSRTASVGNDGIVRYYHPTYTIPKNTTIQITEPISWECKG